VQDFTRSEPVVNTVDDINRTSQEAGLEEVIAKDITQLLDSLEQRHSNEDLEDMDKELSQQKKEQKGKEEKPPLKCTNTSDIQHSFSAMENVTVEL
jgi:hypothetical protein